MGTISTLLGLGGITDTIVNNAGGPVGNTNASVQTAAAVTGLLPATPVTAYGAIATNSVAFGSAIATLDADYAAGNYKNAIGDGISALGDFLGTVGGVAGALGLPIVGVPLGVAGNLVTAIGIAVDNPNLPNLVKTALGEAVTEAKESLNGDNSSLQSTFNNISSDAANYFNLTETAISNAFSSLSTAIQEFGTSAFNAAANSLSNALVNVESPLTSLYESTGESAPSITDTVNADNTFAIINSADSTIATGSVSTDGDGNITGVSATGNNGNATVGQTVSISSGGSITQDVDNPNGTSQITTFNANGTSVGNSYSGPNGTGMLTAQDVENVDGTSHLTTYYPNGSSITSITDSYSGPNGTGLITSQDVENSNGTSALTVYFPDGSSVTTTYSGANGTGSITSTTAGGPGSAGFEGDEVSLGVYYPNLTSADLAAFGLATVGPGIEFPSVAALSTGYEPTGTHLVDASVDLSSNQITFSYPTSEEGVNFLTSPFNGYVFTIANPDAEAITGVSITETNIPGLTAADVSFTTDTVDVNVSGLVLPSNAAGSIQLSVSFAAPAANDLTLNGITNPGGSTITGEDGSGTSLLGTINNNGTLVLDSTGDNTVFAALGNTVLGGGGTVEMSNALQNAIYGPIGQGAALTIGSGQTIEGSGLIADNGLGSIVNQGTFLANQSTPLIIGSPITNSGTMAANGGTLKVVGSVSGTGLFTIGDPSTLEFDGAVASGQTVDMVGPGATLTLTDPSQFAGTIDGFGLGETIDLTSVTFASGGSATLESGNLLQITESGSTYDLQLDPSQRFVGGFALSADPTGGTDISGPPYPFFVDDLTTNVQTLAAGVPYTGPVAGLLEQYIYTGSDNLNVAPVVANTFIHTGGGEDAIDVSHVGGTNVLDGGTNSNFLVGGTGASSFDTFFVDDRSPSADIWSTVANFHTGDAATVFGITQSGFNTSWVDGQGAAGYTGLTLHVTAPGVPTASLTLSGFTTAALTNGQLTTSYGTENDGTPYLYVHAN